MPVADFFGTHSNRIMISDELWDDNRPSQLGAKPSLKIIALLIQRSVFT